MRLQIAEWFPGWTLDYIDTLSRTDVDWIIAKKAAQARMNKPKGK